MPYWLPTAFQMVTPILAMIMAAVINLKIKFAPNEGATTDDLKYPALQFTVWIIMSISAGCCVYGLFLELSSSDPWTAWSVFNIACNITGIFFLMIYFAVLFSSTLILQSMQVWEVLENGNVAKLVLP